jgi:hypothetical protein
MPVRSERLKLPLDVDLCEMKTLEDEIEALANFLDDDDEIQAEFERDMRRRANTLLAEAACIGHGDENRPGFWTQEELDAHIRTMGPRPRMRRDGADDVPDEEWFRGETSGGAALNNAEYAVFTRQNVWNGS